MAKKVVIIEDDSNLLKVMESRITSEGYDVAICNEGTDIIEKLKTEQPDIVVMDIMLPGMDGYTLVRTIRGHKQFSGIPVIMISGKVYEDGAVIAEEIGADAFILKPFDLHVLLSKIKELLEKCKR
ncbi:MAG: response regulator transcription factor [Candidatus Ancaeobacter aquaticus]|nr:response regulator transcription factor [Candidatus Ancaeobacter aquaticus]